MQSNEIILEELKKQERSQRWLAEKIDMSRFTLNYKLKNNSITGDDLIKISKILGIDLNKLKEEL